jgi:threonine dehydrogenase-like Zn-dependent dehydrogenase
MSPNEGADVFAVQCVRSIPAWLLLKGLGSRWPRLYTAPFALVRLRDVPEPRLPGPRWARVQPLLSGICGSDLASITAAGSPFFVSLTSFPFTFGHEVVGRVVEVGPGVTSITVGDRVVLEPALHCVVRGIDPPCPACRDGRTGNCVNVAAGAISPGVQTGYCRDTGGGWSGSLVAHEVQLHRVPDDLSDEAAVLAEPLSCALHAVLRKTGSDPFSLIVGAGTMGLLTLAALRGLDVPGTVTVWAKHPHQQELARDLGAAEVVPATRGSFAELCRRVGAAQHRAEIGAPTVLGGYDVVFDCVGSPRSIDDALRLTRARGTTVLVGMPAIPKSVDWTTIWFKEINVLGAYAYGLESVGTERVRTFDLALRLLRGRLANLVRLVTHRFPLREYKRAIQTALFTGPSRSIKTVFDLRGTTA